MRSNLLRQLARLHGVQHAYEDAAKQHQEASDETLLGMLQVLGVDISRPEQAAERLRCTRQVVWQRPLEPVAVAWDDEAARVRLRLPAPHASGAFRAKLRRDDGESQTIAGQLDGLPTLRRRTPTRGHP